MTDRTNEPVICAHGYAPPNDCGICRDAAYAYPDEKGSWQRGLTKRELFAAIAMQGILASGFDCDRSQMIADRAIDNADALLAALKETQP